MAETVWLQRPTVDEPWGFRVTGGRDFQQPLTVSRGTVGSIASTGLQTGDIILQIGENDTAVLTQGQSNELIKDCGLFLKLFVQKTGTGPPPQPTPQYPQSQQQGYSHPPTRLEQQLSTITAGDYQPYSYGTPSPPTYDAEPGYGSGSASYGSGSPSYGGSAHPGYGDYGGGPPGAPPPVHKAAQDTQDFSSMPDAVMNVAAKNPEKKPFSYAPDILSIQKQRQKVRRRGPEHAIPAYQKALNLPHFEEPKPKRGPVRVVTNLPQSPGSGSPGTPGTPDHYAQPGEEPGAYQHLQYNSPLQMYADDNVTEAFEGQTGGQITGGKVGGQPQASGDITKSATYKMIHGIDQPRKQRPRVIVPEARDQPDYVSTEPGGSEIDTSSIRSHLRPDGDEGVGDYSQASIRYLGGAIPSKSFQRLQRMTNIDPNAAAAAARDRRMARKQAQAQQPQSPDQHTEDIVDISYIGKDIPSRSFRMLQKQIGEPVDDQTPIDKEFNPQSKNVKVVHLRKEQHDSDDAGVTDF